jgi:hypothetical protein
LLSADALDSSSSMIRMQALVLPGGCSMFAATKS